MNRKHQSDRCEPAASVIGKFGGVRKLARELGIDPGAVSRWQTKAQRGGGDGLIPARYHWTLISLARTKAVTLTADDIIGVNGSPR